MITDTAFEEILLQEARELDALFPSIDDQHDTNLDHEQTITEYGTDDEEYDRLLVNALERAENENFCLGPKARLQEDQEMDTDMG